MFDFSQMDGSTLQALLEAAQKKKPTTEQRIGAGISGMAQGISQIGQPGQFYKRGEDGSLNPQGGGGGAAAGAAGGVAGASTDPDAAKKRAKLMKGLLKKIFKSNFAQNDVPIDIRPPEGDRAMPDQYASNDPYRFGGTY